MAQTIKRFLIGLGFDTKEFDQGQQNVNAGLSSMRGGVLAVSAAMVGAFGAAAASVISTANRVDQLALRTSNLKTSTQFVYDYGNALRTLGGDASEAESAVKSIEEALNNLRVRGELGPLQDLALAGIDISRLQAAPDAQEFLRTLADQMPRLSIEQRAVARDALGLSDAALKSLTMGVDEFDAAIKRAGDITGDIDGLIDNSRRLNEASSELALTVEGIQNELAKEFLPALTGAANWINEFLQENRGFFSTTESVRYAPFVTPFFVAKDIIFGGDESDGGGTSGAPYAGPRRDMSPTGGFLPRGNTLIREDYDASSAIPMMSRETRAQEQEQAAEAIANAISRSPVRVQNDITLQLDGQALETKIIDVTERQAYDTLEDLRTTTDR